MKQLYGKTILVTGGTGFIGGCLLERLGKTHGLQLVVVSRRSTSPANRLKWITSPLERITKDTFSAAGVRHVDILFHLAGYIPKSSTDANRMPDIFRDNVEATKAVLDALPNEPERVIYTSTVDVYSPTKSGKIIDESSPIGPSNLYGASKLFCEFLVSAHAAAGRSKYSILRLGHIFGSGEEAFSKLIPVCIRKMINGQPPEIFGDGSAMRDYLYVGDAVEALIRAATADGNLEPVNVVRGQSVSVREVVDLIARLVAFKGKIQYAGAHATGISLRFDAGKMRQTLGNWKFCSLEEGLRREIEHFRSL